MVTLDKILAYLLYGHVLCGIEHTDYDSEDVLYVTLLQKQKTAVDISDSFEVNQIEALGDVLKKNQHATLIINTSKVITKKIDASTNEKLQLVYKAFPNIKLDDFYYEINKQGDSSFISICRKDYVNKLILKYLENNVIITEFYLGNLVISSVCEFIDQNSFHTSNCLIQKKKKWIVSIILESSSNQIDYDINGLKINNQFLLSLTGALNNVLKRYIPITNASNKKESLLSEYKQFQFFKVFFKFGLGVIFMTLLINYFLFNHYYNRVKDLQAVSLYNNTASQKIITLKKEVDSIQKRAEDMLQIDSSKSSFFINDIIQNLPNSILLSKLNYQPLIKNIKNNEPIINDFNVILISGMSSNSEIFSAWVSQLEKLTWVFKVDILDYNDTTVSNSNFSIKLSLN